MRWSIRRSVRDATRVEPDWTDRSVPGVLAMGRLRDVLTRRRDHSVRPRRLDGARCLEETATGIVRISGDTQLDAEITRSVPRQADLMILAGTVLISSVPAIRRLYEQMASPRWIVAVGSCANSNGRATIYSVMQGVDKVLPVDVYLPSFPPRADALLQALSLLEEASRTEQRPLRWVVDDEGAYRADAGSWRDCKCSEHKHTTVWASATIP